jgi:hypothetical protein
MNFRERWYAERNLPYEPPPLLSVPGWQCIGRLTPKEEPPKSNAGELAPKRRTA